MSNIFFDNGRGIVNGVVEEILNRNNFKVFHGSPYHPQSHGQIERFNRKLKSRLICSRLDKKFCWINHVHRLVFDYNNMQH